MLRQIFWTHTTWILVEFSHSNCLILLQNKLVVSNHSLKESIEHPPHYWKVSLFDNIDHPPQYWKISLNSIDHPPQYWKVSLSTILTILCSTYGISQKYCTFPQYWLVSVNSVDHPPHYWVVSLHVNQAFELHIWSAVAHAFSFTHNRR